MICKTQITEQLRVVDSPSNGCLAVDNTKGAAFSYSVHGFLLAAVQQELST